MIQHPHSVVTPNPQLKLSVIEYKNSNGKHNDKKINEKNQLPSLVVGSRFDSCNGIIWIWNHGFGDSKWYLHIIPLLRNYLHSLLVYPHSFKLKVISTYIFSLKLIYVIVLTASFEAERYAYIILIGTQSLINNLNSQVWTFSIPMVKW